MMDLHSDYIEHMRVVQYCLDFKTQAIQKRLRVLASIYLNNLEQSVSAKVVSIINFGLGGAVV